MALGALLMLLEPAATLAIPWLGGKLTETLLSGAGHAGWSVPAVLATLSALFAVQALLKFGNAYYLGNTAQRIVADLKIRVYDHLQVLPLAFFHQRRQGDTLALLTHDTYTISGFVTGTALAIVPLLLTVAGAMFFMFRLQRMLALWATLLIPLFYEMMKIFGRRNRPLAQQLQQEYATSIAIAEENLGMLPAIKTFTREAQESARYRERIGRVMDLTVQQVRVNAALGPVIQALPLVRRAPLARTAPACGT